MSWKRELAAAVKAELAAEQTAERAEGDRRQTWWDTTWVLAGVPREEWGEAQADFVKQSGQSASHASHRRSVGGRFAQSALARILPQPRFAEVASGWIGKDGDAAKVKEAINLLVQAERDEMSLREFKQALTGKPWTNTAENLTEADEDAIVERVAKKRPASVVGKVVKQHGAESVARQVARTDAAAVGKVAGETRPGLKAALESSVKTMGTKLSPSGKAKHEKTQQKIKLMFLPAYEARRFVKKVVELFGAWYAEQPDQADDFLQDMEAAVADMRLSREGSVSDQDLAAFMDSMKEG